MDSNPSGRTRDHIPRQAKSASQAKSALELNIATGMPMNEGVHVIEQKYASGALIQTTKCIGCQAVVKHLKKHLAWKPYCQRFYCDDELKSMSLESRKESRKKYNLAHQKEIKAKKAIQYKEKMQGGVKIGTPQKSGSNASTTTHAKMPSHLSHIPPAHFHEQNICSICEMAFARQDKLTRHLKEVHEVDKKAGQEKASNFVCMSCNERFTRKESLMRHLQTMHKKSSLACSVCDKEFSRKDSLQRHVNEVHMEDKRFKCPACPLTFSRRDILDVHVNKAAKNKELHGCVKHCKFCNKDILFSSMRAWKDHSWRTSCKTKQAEVEMTRKAWVA